MNPHEILASQGNCAQLGVDVQIMYPEPGDLRGEAIAKSVCEGCVVIDLCRETGFANHESGVMGGMTQKERSYWHRQVVRAERSIKIAKRNNAIQNAVEIEPVDFL